MSADFLSGGSMVAALTIALFFLRYWLQTRDRLFLIFSAGFLVFAASRLILAFLDEDDEGRIFVYGLRLIAFGLILGAIIDKNRSPFANLPAGRSNGHRPAAAREASDHRAGQAR
jgi:drug/metabolite transporter superfamily protein YnfA